MPATKSTTCSYAGHWDLRHLRIDAWWRALHARSRFALAQSFRMNGATPDGRRGSVFRCYVNGALGMAKQGPDSLGAAVWAIIVREGGLV
jgi:hypothetical protein